jgi:pimeloyl-ACP methyl ester carboxylesterase
MLVGIVLGAGGILQHIFGEDVDVIGFDPRGLGFSFPTADCFSFPNGPIPNDTDITKGKFRRSEFAIAYEAVGLVNSSDMALTRLDHHARALAKLCGLKDSFYGNDSILRHVDTPNVARDMLSIVDAWDELRDNTMDEGVREMEKSNPPETKGKLTYIGFSYGKHILLRLRLEQD